MKAILKFTLPEEAGDHQTALDGWKWKGAAHELDERLRIDAKNGPAAYSPEQLRLILRETLEERGLRFDI